MLIYTKIKVSWGEKERGMDGGHIVLIIEFTARSRLVQEVGQCFYFLARSGLIGQLFVGRANWQFAETQFLLAILFERQHLYIWIERHHNGLDI